MTNFDDRLENYITTPVSRKNSKRQGAGDGLTSKQRRRLLKKDRSQWVRVQEVA